MSQLLRIAIDGPAAAGKSTVAKKIAKQLSIIYVDTGAMYRALTLQALYDKVDVENEEKLLELLQNISIQLEQHEQGQQVMLNHENVTNEVRTDDVSNAVSQVAQHASIRQEMVKRQQKIADNKDVVMDGRDIGTHVLPDAEVKIFLLASVEERAQRRFQENKRKGFATSLKKLKQEIEARDEQDMNRKSSPLVQAKDAIAIDTTSLSIDEVVAKILEYVKQQPNNR